MALKDWHKIGDNHWVYKEGASYNRDGVAHIMIEHLKGKPTDYKYEVYAIGRFVSGVAAAFKTESQALKFAKNYMMRH